jgi:uncharacterized protein (DUF1810 family)
MRATTLAAAPRRGDREVAAGDLEVVLAGVPTLVRGAGDVVGGVLATASVCAAPGDLDSPHPAALRTVATSTMPARTAAGGLIVATVVGARKRPSSCRGALQLARDGLADPPARPSLGLAAALLRRAMDVDPFSLSRFELAQDESGVYALAVAELRAGRKQGHWMWFVFPQLAGLGSSATSRRYALASLEEARAYLAHPVLGSRLRECAGILAGLEGRSAEEALGPVDAMKLRSSMTLFAIAAPQERIFQDVLERRCDGVRDARTELLLERPTEPGSPKPRSSP